MLAPMKRRVPRAHALAHLGRPVVGPRSGGRGEDGAQSFRGNRGRPELVGLDRLVGVKRLVGLVGLDRLVGVKRLVGLVGLGALLACHSAPAVPNEQSARTASSQQPAQEGEPVVSSDGVAELKVVARYGGAAWLAHDEAKAVALSPDGRWAVSGGGEGGTPLVWDARTGAVLGALEGEHMSPSSLAFSPDGKLVAATDVGRRIVLWDAVSRQVARRLEAHEANVYRFAFSPDGRLLASGDADGVLLLWDLVSGAAPRTLANDQPSTGELAFSPDGRALAASKDGGILTVFDVASGKVVRESPAQPGTAAAIHGLAYSFDGKAIVSGETLATGGEAVVVRDAATLAVQQALMGHTAHVNVVRTTPDDRLVVSASGDGSARVWELATGRAVRWLPTAGTPLWSLELSRDGRLAAAAGGGRKIQLFSLDSGQSAVTPADHEAAIVRLAFSPDGRSLASGDADGRVVLRDVKSGAVRLRLPAQPRTIAALVWAPDGARLLTVSHGAGRYWDPETGAPLGELTFGRFDGVVVSPDGRTLVASDESRIVRLLDATTGAPLRTFGEAQPHDDIRQNLMQPSSVSFSPDGRELAVARWDQAIHVWDVKRGALVRTLPGTLHVAYSPAGDVIAGNVGTVSKRGTELSVRLWSAETGAELHNIDCDGEPQFSPDGRVLLVFCEAAVAADADRAGDPPRELCAWSVETGRLVARASSPGPRAHTAAVSPDGKLVCTGSADGAVVCFALRGVGR